MCARRYLVLLPLVLCVLLPGRAAWSKPAGKPAAGASAPTRAAVEESLRAHRYAEAISGLQALLVAAKPPEDADTLLLLLGRASMGAGQPQDAAAAFARLRKLYPKSKWSRKAAFSEADALARLRDFDHAASLYSSEMKALLSPERREEIAAFYLRFADGYFSPKPGPLPGAEPPKPDYRRARSLYTRALDLDLPPAREEETRFQIARCDFETQEYPKAREGFAAVRKEFAKGTRATEARYYEALSALRQGDRLGARLLFQDLLDADPKGLRAADAAYALCETYGVPKPQSEREALHGARSLTDFIGRFAADPRAPRAVLLAAETLLVAHDPERAAGVLRDYLGSAEKPAAAAAPGAAAEAPERAQAMEMLGRVLRAQSRYQDAVAAWTEFQKRYPDHPLWTQVDTRIRETAYAEAQAAYAAKNYEVAARLWQAFAARYPTDGRIPEILIRLGQSEYDRERWNEAIAAWEKVPTRFPKSEAAGRACLLIGLTYETKLEKLPKAIDAYQRAAETPLQGPARQRLQAFQSRQMVLYTERAFTTAEKPALKAITRNIASLSLRAYKIDLADYFARKHTTLGVEKLDVALIEPDSRWTQKIEPFEEFRLRESAVPLPFTAPGAYVITCSALAKGSETPALEATTVALISDLQVIVKSTRRDLFVLAQSRLTGDAYPKVSLTFDDGRRVLGTGVTGKDGVYHRPLEALKDVGQICVLAVSEGHCAGTEGSLGDIQYVEGRQPRGYLYCDRPVYRPGQTVRAWAIARKVADGAYTFRKGDAYEVQALDPGGQPVHRERVRLGDFGTFDLSFQLPDEAAVGEYTIRACEAVPGGTGDGGRGTGPEAGSAVAGSAKERKGTRPATSLVPRPSSPGPAPSPVGAALQFDGTFTVARYELPKVQITLDLPRAAYLRGEEIRGKITAKYYYGEPVRRRTLRWGYPGGPEAKAETGTDGSVEFRIDTRQFDEEATLNLWARLDEEQAQASVEVRVVQSTVSAEVETLRDVYQVNEPFQARVTLSDAMEGEGAKPRPATAEARPPAKAELLVLLSETDPTGVVTQREVSRQPVAAGEDGKASVALKLGQAGRYLLRAAGSDPGGNPFAAERWVQVVGDEDSQKLRILADTDQFKEGQTAEIPVLSRLPEGKVLVTCEGEILYAYKLVSLAQGMSKVPVELTQALAPRFVFSVCAIERAGAKETGADRFHSATKVFEVERDLKVALKPQKPSYRPGERVRVAVEATDHTGKPVAAELSLAAVDASLFAVAEDPAGDPGDTFYDRPLDDKSAVLTQSSAAFHFTAEGQQRALLVRVGDDILRRGLIAARGRILTADAVSAIVREEIRPESITGLDVDAASLDAGGEGAAQRAMPAVPAQPNAPAAVGAPGRPALRDSRPTPLPAMAGKPEKQAGAAEAPADAARQFFPETAFWNAHVVTGKDGKTTVEFDLPQSLTRWSLLARGVTLDTLVGQAGSEVVAAQPFVAELKLPALAVEGDTLSARASLHNNTGQALKATLRFGAEGGDRPVEETREVSVEADGVAETYFAVPVGAGQQVVCSLDAQAEPGGARDSVRTVVPVRPWGTERVVSAGGTATGDANVSLQLPAGEYRARSLAVTVGPSISRALIDAALETGWGSLVEAPVHRARARLAALSLLRRQNRGDSPDAVALRARLQADIASIVRLQKEDGSWSWADRGQPGDPYVTASAAELLVEAADGGVAVPPEARDRALAAVQNLFQGAGEGDTWRKIALLHALAGAGKADFAHANRLFRLRGNLDTRSLALLTLALVRMQQPAMASELATALKTRAQKGEEGGSFQTGSVDEGSRRGGDPVEVTALALLALHRAGAAEAEVAEAARWLWSRRTGTAWPSPGGTAAAVAALSALEAAGGAQADRYTLTLGVNGKEFHRFTVDANARSVTIPAPAAALTAAGPEKVAIRMEGRGTYAYTAVLRGFTPEVRAEDERFDIRRTYLAPPRVVDGREIASGFSTAEVDSPWENVISQLPAGQRARVRLSWSGNSEKRPGGYVMLREPLPAGARPLEASIQGSFERYEVGDGEVLFYFRVGDRRWSGGSAQYDLHGVLPGEYRVLPARASAYYEPGIAGQGEPGALTVLARDGKPKDTYRPTPDELYALGKGAFEREEYGGARESLLPLFDGFRLRPEPYRETARMLFYSALRSGDAPQSVRFFEVLRERYPDLVVPFNDVLKVAAAYAQIGEREREIQVLRAAAEAAFDRESRVSGALMEENEFLAAVEFTRRLIEQYPDAAPVQTAHASVAQLLYDKASKTKADQRDLPEALTKAALLDSAIGQLREFLLYYPGNPAADEAGFSLLNALMERGRHAEAAGLAADLQERYPESRYRDAYQYLQGYALFLSEEYEKALAAANRLAEAQFKGADGTMAPSAYRPFALYIAAQVCHALGKPAEAVELYGEVAERFPDAAEAKEYFARKALTLPEASTIVGDGKASVRLGYRNVTSAEVQVYRVDLLRFYQNRRSLQEVAQMNLAGVRPLCQVKLDLKKGKPYRDNVTDFTLPLKERGAYFLIARADGADATGILLRTDLSLEVQEDARSGQVRVNVLQRATGKAQARAEVWVSGSGNDAFTKGESDLRGIFTAEDIRGTATVVAAREGQYAFYRGTAFLQAGERRADKDRAGQRAAGKRRSAEGEANDQLEAQNVEIRSRQTNFLNERFRGGYGGVQVQQMK